jgi:hypothetical protein
MNDPIQFNRRQALQLLAVTGAAGAAILSTPTLAAKCETDGTPLQFTPKPPRTPTRLRMTSPSIRNARIAAWIANSSTLAATCSISG